MKQKYIKEINKVVKQYEKDFKRKDLSFELMTIMDLVETAEDNEIILDYLLNEFNIRMKKRYDKLNSKEYKEKCNYI